MSKYDFSKIQDPSVREYMRRKMEGDKQVSEAQDTADMVGYGNIAGKVLNDYNNSQKDDVILRNRFQDLGKTPSIKEASRKEYDDFGSGKMAQGMVGQARQDASADLDAFGTEMQLAQFDQKQAEHQDQKAIQAAYSDPNSEESKQARAFLSHTVPTASQIPNYENLSAKQIEKVSPMLFKKWKAEQSMKQAQIRTSRANTRRSQDSEYKAKLQEMNLRQKELGLQKLEKEVQAGPKMNDSQGKARGFGKRIEQALKDMSEIDKTGFDRTDLSSGFGSYMPNLVRTDVAVSQDQAEENFINANLRRESGAAISDSEFAKAERQYFPRVGDGPRTLEQKARNRAQVLENFKVEVGTQNWDKEAGQPTQQGSPQQPKVSTEDSEAVAWAKANPSDPRSAEILKQNGVK